jgi:hypothetical protein
MPVNKEDSEEDWEAAAADDVEIKVKVRAPVPTNKTSLTTKQTLVDGNKRQKEQARIKLLMRIY